MQMPGNKPSVTVYTTPTCPHCVMATSFLRENKINFEEKNVAEDRAAATEMIEKSKQMGVPVIEINGKIIVGFDSEAVKKALGIK